MSWYAIRFDVLGADLELLDAELYEIVPEGWELQENDGASGSSRPGTSSERAGSRARRIIVHTDVADEGAALERANAMVAALPPGLVSAPQVEAVDEKVWAHNWRGHFPPLRAGRRLLVVPPWHELSAQEQAYTVVRINPAMAFGTGHHASTAACLDMLDRLVRPGDLVADVGTGSGILAIAALALGASRVYATDNDPIAVNSARENAVLNHVGDRLHLQTHCGPPETPGQTADQAPGQTPGYDIVVANIFAETLVEMAGALTSCVMNGGHLLLAGIGSERLPLVQTVFRSPTWTSVLELRDDPWIALALRHEAEGENDVRAEQ